MLYLLYDIAMLMAAPFILLFALTRSLRGKRRREGVAERLGFISPAKLAVLGGDRPIMIHAVSVGETIAAKPLLKALKKRFPGRKIVLSNVTETGHEIAVKLPEVDLCVYFPFDFAPVARRVLMQLSPCGIVIMETELWPNFLRTARELGIPTILANGRISDRSYPRYLKANRAFRTILGNLAGLCMQSEVDARRITAIGASPERVHVTGNLKYDIPLTPVAAETRASLRQCFGVPPDALVMTAASTHPGEEEQLLQVYRRLLPEHPTLSMILVPRHPERGREVANILAGMGMQCRLRSEVAEGDNPMAAGEVLVVDTIGELMQFSALADLAFVGGSLVPVGGHNVLEPVSLELPVLFGPHMHNFREISVSLGEHGGGVQVPDAEGLLTALHELLADPNKRRAMGKKGGELLAENGGATERHVEIFARLLGVRGEG